MARDVSIAYLIKKVVGSGGVYKYKKINGIAIAAQINKAYKCYQMYY
jgi:hypothetical protein